MVCIRRSGFETGGTLKANKFPGSKFLKVKALFVIYLMYTALPSDHELFTTLDLRIALQLKF